MSDKPEYIERKALYQAFVFYAGKRIPEVDVDGLPITVDLQTIKKTIRELPAADVEPVVRGEWIEMRDPYGDLTGWIHEECGHETQCASNYCSKCGAKMTFIERSGSGE